jgi:hypothetical protein
MATRGLKKPRGRTVALAFDEGLVGLVGRLAEPKAGVFLRIGEVDGLRQAANQPHQAFIERQRNGAPARFFW